MGDRRELDGILQGSPRPQRSPRTTPCACEQPARQRAPGSSSSRALSLQAIHGDAHLHNVINGPHGRLWNDWEDTFLGPRAWDLGCLHGMARVCHRDPAPVAAAQDGYGDPLDEDVLDAVVRARRFQGTVWSIVMARVQPEYRERSEALLAG